MAISGCHNCRKVSPPGTPYEETACASCKLAIEHHRVNKTDLFDTDIPPEELEEQGPSTEDLEAQIPLNVPERILSLMRETCESSIYMGLASTVLRMVELAKLRPVMFEALVLKLRFPHMSYYDIGGIMHCSKQNVLYHLKQAVHVFPELADAIITDTRFSGGRYAIRTAARTYRKDAGMNGLRKGLYGTSLESALIPLDVINKILAAPYMSKEAELAEFDSYTGDEDDIGSEISADTAEVIRHMEGLSDEGKYRP